MTTKNSERPLKTLPSLGFTIVELLIVIVIIGILAAIVIVAYNGITNQAKTTNGKFFSSSIINKVEVWKIYGGYYPTHAELVSNTPINPSADLGSIKNQVYDYSAYTSQSRDPDFYEGNKKVIIGRTQDTDGNIIGMCIYYWNYTDNKREGVKVGNGYCYPYT